VVAQHGEHQRGFHIPLHDFIGMTVDPGPPAAVEVPLTDAVRGAVAPVHGGIVASIGDVACAAALTELFDPETEVPVSTELHVRYYGQPREGPLRAEAHVVHRGSRIIGAECVVSDGGGRQIARISGTYMVVPRPGAPRPADRDARQDRDP